MKLQYLGDSKDSFKWDYHDYITSNLGFALLNVMLMMTPDDRTNEGKTKPDRYLARNEIIKFCNELRNRRDLSIIQSLTDYTKSSYKVILHKPTIHITSNNRKSYFTEISNHSDQVVLLDPDNGFEPEKGFNKKHVKYLEISTILDQISVNSVISVFQHFRRIKFPDDFVRIKERLLTVISSVRVSAVYWNQLMFVLISKSEKTHSLILQLNNEYSERYKVKTIQ